MSGTKRTYRVIISGGGTGGHIYPALAIANELKFRWPDIEILFVGALGKMEMNKIPEAGFTIKGIWISGLQRKQIWKNIFFPIKVIVSIIQSIRILNHFRPDIAIGVGGFASGPLLYAASLKGISTLIQEQNSYAGITNKILARKANKICVAYEQMDQYFPKEKTILTGNPVRKDIIDTTSLRAESVNFFQFDNSKKTLFVMGGSLGARTINISVFKKIQKILDEEIQLIWQIGKFYYDDYQLKLREVDMKNIRIYSFLEEMSLAYAMADVVISRAGALSISELCLVGKPVIFVPSPNVAEDHQTKNANALVRKEAALMISDKEAPEKLIDVAIALMADAKKQERLSKNIRDMARPYASEKIVDEIENLLN